MRSPQLQAAIDALASGDSHAERGAVFTPPTIVGGILDLCGYVTSQDLTKRRVLEPSCGDGSFFLELTRRLIISAHNQGVAPELWSARLGHCLMGVEIHAESAQRCSAQAAQLLVDAGMRASQAADLARAWILPDDFLLTAIEPGFDLIVGNPPYVRQERIPKALLREYKRHYVTLYDRADLYVLFFERGLDLLKSNGKLGFICANRWIKNNYGKPLREKISRGFNLDTYLDLSRVKVFGPSVDVYPSVTVIRRAPASKTRVCSPAGRVPLKEIFAAIGKPGGPENPEVSEVKEVARGEDPWLVDVPHILPVLRNLEASLPPLEQAGVHVGIGVATGADRIFVAGDEALASWEIEPSRLLPLAMPADLQIDAVRWAGQKLVNPWGDKGLVELRDYPRLGAYLDAHREILCKRHIAKKFPQRWYRTIDRVHPYLTRQPKLLIPDIKGRASVVYDPGCYYPHHNLYVVTAPAWDLRALQTLLRSSVAMSFVAAYCVRIAGGFLRYQAQYLRRIRVPSWQSLSATQRENLVRVSCSVDQELVDQAAFAAYGLGCESAQRLASFAKASCRRTSHTGPG